MKSAPSLPSASAARGSFKGNAPACEYWTATASIAAGQAASASHQAAQAGQSHRPPPRITDGGCKACKASVPDTANARGTENIPGRAAKARARTATARTARSDVESPSSLSEYSK
jgi:hypothetical protein